MSEGRKLPLDTVGKIARGRVWTGAQAKGLGLVDSLGGLPQAIDRAKALAGLKGEVRIKPFATSTNPFDAIARLFGGGAADAELRPAWPPPCRRRSATARLKRCCRTSTTPSSGSRGPWCWRLGGCGRGRRFGSLPFAAISHPVADTPQSAA